MKLIFDFEDIKPKRPECGGGFFEYNEVEVELAIREFCSRIIETVELRRGLCYWLYSSPGVRIGTVKVEE